jgi:hypothetical protein
MASFGSRADRGFGASQRQSCATDTCFATFDSSPARADEVRHCNRTGPDGGHAQRWDGQSWQAVAGEMQHDKK